MNDNILDNPEALEVVMNAIKVYFEINNTEEVSKGMLREWHKVMIWWIIIS